MCPPPQLNFFGFRLSVHFQAYTAKNILTAFLKRPSLGVCRRCWKLEFSTISIFFPIKRICPQNSRFLWKTCFLLKTMLKDCWKVEKIGEKWQKYAVRLSLIIPFIDFWFLSLIFDIWYLIFDIWLWLFLLCFSYGKK